MSELWKDVAGYDGIYQVSDHGQVRSLDRKVKNKNGIYNKPIKGKTLAQHQDRNGYMYCYFSVDGHGKNVKVHRIVCRAFHGEPFVGAVANHIDGNKGNNSANNLEWCSNQENTGHAIKTGLWKNIGEAASSDVLTEKQVLEIRNNHTDSYDELARMYGISKASIADIKKFRSWKQLGGDEFLTVPDSAKLKLGLEIRKVRKENKMTIVSFASSLGVSRYTVMRWESGKMAPMDGTLRNLIEKYNLQLDKAK
ncbi:NUMOD4 domain-containing protein [Sporolactobacillus sp. STSJ-5]|uniref:NUMOD4 domain-containing protein n=1 Tax=Sporolactobacillus sp. STSJ-5 TaxID=2965076 RepID=UPI002104F5F5|nr:NUMOD4 domain-containing protein [Sporolactobacillus sp. STSJ-5]MCQ2009271.1 NUMOD4 domain-containing protein [Sporolactobacillus sp. STSJ-5]